MDGETHTMRSKTSSRIWRILRPWLILLLVCAGFSLNPAFCRTFWSSSYLPTILQQAATNIILAVGMTFVVITGGIDLSAGSLVALCGVALGLAVTETPPAFILFTATVGPMALAAWSMLGRLGTTGRRQAVAGVGGLLLASALVAMRTHLFAGPATLLTGVGIALGVGLTAGLLNGTCITAGRVPPFVVTLGMLTAARGLAVHATMGNSVSGLPPALAGVGQGIPLIGVALAVVVFGSVILTRTRLGRHLTATGGNEEASRLSGVQIDQTRIVAYAISGLCAAIAAIVLTAKFRLADTGAGTGAELNAIAAVVIGGTSLSGGRGSVLGSLVGALTIAVLNAGLVLVSIPDTLQGVVIGAVIVATVFVDQYPSKRGYAL